MPKTTKPKKMWVYAPKKPAPPKVPEALKREVETKANALIESVAAIWAGEDIVLRMSACTICACAIAFAFTSDPLMPSR